MARRPTLQEQLDALIEMFTPKIKAAFLAAIADITSRVVMREMIEAIRMGDPIAAFRAIGFSDAAMRPIIAQIEQAFEVGGMTVGGSFPKNLRSATGTVVYRFDVRNSRAEAWLRDYSGQLITRMREEASNAVRQVMQDGMAAGRNPNNIALDIAGRINKVTGRREGGIIGLNAQQEKWVANARRELSGEIPDASYFNRVRRNKRFDSAIKKAINEGRALDSATINRAIGQYSDNLLLYRGETIARTEAIHALNRSEYEAYRQVVETGAVSNNAVKRIWDSAGDARVRESHRAMDGQSVGMDEPFAAPDGSLLMFPGDTSLGASASEIINCRCKTRMNVDWLYGVK